MKNILNGIVSFLTSNRLKSLYWRAGAMIVVGVINAILENLAGWGVTGQVQVILGLVLGEITKAINNWSQGKVA
jgi:hypothetical protein